MPYQNIACLGAEEGLFPILFGKFVFDGKVIAYESDKKQINITKNLLKKINLGNVELNQIPSQKKLNNILVDGIFVTNWDSYKKLMPDFENNLNKNTWVSILSEKDQSSEFTKIFKNLKKDSEIYINKKYKLYNYRINK